MGKTVDTLSHDEIIKLICFCDRTIEGANNEELIQSLKQNYDSTFNEYVSALITKLIILSGVTNSYISKIKISDYDSINSTILINGIHINLPRNFASQLQHYSELRLSLPNTDNDSFFMLKMGNKTVDFQKSNYSASVMGKMMKKCFNTYSMEPIRKHTITELMKTEGNYTNILKLCGCSVPTLIKHHTSFKEIADFDIEARDRKILPEHYLRAFDLDF